MNFCHSFYSKPVLTKGLIDLESVIWLSSLSVRHLQLLGQRVVLYADKLGIELLKPVVPYDEFIEIEIPDYVPSDCYAVAKFMALEKMNLDDIHIDNDVFIKTSRCIELITDNGADVVTQLIYKAGMKDHEQLLNAINYLRILNFLPDEFPFMLGTNNGIIGIRNQQLKDDYIDGYLGFLKNNSEILSKYNRKDIVIDTWNEEWRLCNMIFNEGRNLKLYTLFGNIVDDPNRVLVTEKANILGYEHLCGLKYPFVHRVMSELYCVDRQLFDNLKIYMNNLLQLLVSNVFTKNTL